MKGSILCAMLVANIALADNSTNYTTASPTPATSDNITFTPGPSQAPSGHPFTPHPTPRPTPAHTPNVPDRTFPPTESPGEREERDFAFAFGIFFGINMTLFLSILACYKQESLIGYFQYIFSGNWIRRDVRSVSARSGLLSSFMRPDTIDLSSSSEFDEPDGSVNLSVVV